MDSNLPYMIMGEIEGKLIVCININHPYYSNIAENGTTERENDYKINCVFDALSELHCMNKYGNHNPEDIRINKDLFLKRWVQFGTTS